MSDSEEVTTPAAEEAPAPVATAAAAKKKKPSKSKSKKPSTHPKFRDMAIEAIGALKERNGSSRQAILKYIRANYTVDESSDNNHLKMTLKAGVKNGTLKQVKGTGASGSFRLGEKGKDKPAKKSTKSAATTTKKAKSDKKKVSKPKKTKAKTEKKAKASPKKKTAAKSKKTKSPKKAATKSKAKKGKAAKK